MCINDCNIDCLGWLKMVDGMVFISVSENSFFFSFFRLFFSLRFVFKDIVGKMKWEKKIFKRKIIRLLNGLWK